MMRAKPIARLLSTERPQPLMRVSVPLPSRCRRSVCPFLIWRSAGALIDDTAVGASLRPCGRLREFLTDGARSPLYRDDAEQARRTARDTRRCVRRSCPRVLTKPTISTDASHGATRRSERSRIAPLVDPSAVAGSSWLTCPVHRRPDQPPQGPVAPLLPPISGWGATRGARALSSRDGASNAIT